MGRGERNVAIKNASSLLFGPRSAGDNDRSQEHFDDALEDNDFDWAARLLDQVECPEARRQIIEAMSAYAHDQERVRCRVVLDAFGVRPYRADTMVIENEHTDNQILHFSAEAGEKLQESLGTIDSPPVQTACGITLGPRRMSGPQGGGGLTSDGGRAPRGSWQELPDQTSHCADCAKLADSFPESQESPEDGELLHGISQRTEELINLEADDLKDEALRAYRQATAEIAAKTAVAEGDKTFQRLYQDKYDSARSGLYFFLPKRNLVEAVSEAEWQEGLSKALAENGDDNPSCIDHVDEMLESAGLETCYRRQYNPFP